VQIGRTEADVFLVDETTRKTVDKRLSLTLAIDVSRAGRRDSLSMDKSSRISLALCILKTVYDKSARVEVSIVAQDCLLASRCVGFGRVLCLPKSRAGAVKGFIIVSGTAVGTRGASEPHQALPKFKLRHYPPLARTQRFECRAVEGAPPQRGESRQSGA